MEKGPEDLSAKSRKDPKVAREMADVEKWYREPGKEGISAEDEEMVDQRGKEAAEKGPRISPEQVPADVQDKINEGIKPYLADGANAAIIKDKFVFPLGDVVVREKPNVDGAVTYTVEGRIFGGRGASKWYTFRIAKYPDYLGKLEIKYSRD
jgi:hypothetical protein